MRFLDFIEIGTSDFDTFIQNNDEKYGISIEPIHYYLDRLPNKKNCMKLNMGVSNYIGTCKVHYLSQETIQKYNFPDWVRGCNSINTYHKTVTNICKEKGLEIEKISEEDEVDVKTLYEIMNQYCKGVYYLKIDTEGHDTVILKKFYEDMTSNLYLPHVIQFESNVLTKEDDVDEIIQLFYNKGYDLIEKSHDTVLNLNLNRIVREDIFTDEWIHYSIPDYPPNYSIDHLPHENTLEGAKEYCIKYQCTGVTLQEDIFQVRNGDYIQYSEVASSWLFI